MRTLGNYAAAILLIAVPLAACNREGSSKVRTEPGPTVSDAASPIGADTKPMSIEGTIEGTPSQDLLTVSGKQIKLDPNAEIRSGSLPVTFADLRDGMKVRVSAEPNGSEPMKGTLVDVLDSVGLPYVKQGTIAGFEDKGSYYEFKVGDKLYRGDAATQIVDANGTAQASALHNAMAVDVTGLQRADYVYVTKIDLSKAKKSPANGRRPR